jgi:hypothetical protein
MWRKKTLTLLFRPTSKMSGIYYYPIDEGFFKWKKYVHFCIELFKSFMPKAYLTIAFSIVAFICEISEAQVVINEISNKNSGQVADEDNEYEDWIELYNPSNSACNLAETFLSDDSTNLEKWKFPSYEMQANEHLLVFASGKNRIPAKDHHWESPVLPEHTFFYLVPTSSTPANWNQPDFIPVDWNTGRAGFGYGDNDDSSVVASNTMVIYIRKSFTLPAGFSFKDVDLHVDYDDGFVAYLNGVEIARVNINGTPTWNSAASAGHEALMYSGGQPEKFPIDTSLIKSLLDEGENVFAIEVHNINASTDLSLIPFLSFLVNNSYSLFDRTPSSLIYNDSNNFHTNFKIDSRGEKIFLFNKNENSKETVWVKNLSFGWSMGRVTDGANTWGIFTQPTPSMPNTTKAFAPEREPEPVFSISEGYFTGTQTISLSSTSSTSEIRYTIDGSEPLKTSVLYNGTPIVVVGTKTLRACCFSKAGKLQSRAVANTYFINNSGHSVPVLSVITNNSNLYGAQGIFDNWQQEWEKSCYVEYFDANMQKKFEQFSGIKIDGGAGGSRSNPQHSFRLEFNNNIYGDGEVRYKLIPDRPDRESYNSVYLRNGSNQWLTFQFKDAMECKMMSYNTNNYYSAGTQAVVYINGNYFGLYEMREKVNDEYFEKNYGATIDSTFHLLSLSYYYNSILRALNGSVDTFTHDYNTFLGLLPTDANYLQKADKIIDLDYYTDYVIAQSWIADTDWPFNNIKIVKGDFTKNRWRFVLLDLEWSLNPNGWSNSNTDHIAFMLGYDANMPYLRFWKELIKNQTYKKKFINRFADLMNSSYLPENTTAIAQSVYDSSYPEMRSEFVQWGGGESQATARMNQYASNLNIFKTELKNRSNTVRNNIVSNFGLTGSYTLELQVQPEGAGVIQINTISPEVYPWTGVYFAGIPIRLEARGVGNYVFDGWEPNNKITDPNNPVIESDVKTNGYKFIAKFRKQTPALAVTISEINYSSTLDFPNTDWIELFNYGQTTVDLTGWYITDGIAEHKWIIPGSFYLKTNERLVLTSNINKFNNTYPNVQNVVGSFGFGLSSSSDSIQLFDNYNKLIAGLKYSSQSPWPTEAYDQGMTLELIDPDEDLSKAENWFAGCLGGSPGLAYSQCGTGISISSESLKATLYPNPAIDQVYIVLPATMNYQKISCRIFDIMGKEVLAETFQAISQFNLNLSVADLSEGFYILQLSDGNLQQNLMFVKQKD